MTHHVSEARSHERERGTCTMWIRWKMDELFLRHLRSVMSVARCPDSIVRLSVFSFRRTSALANIADAMHVPAVIETPANIPHSPYPTKDKILLMRLMIKPNTNPQITAFGILVFKKL